MLIKYFTVHFSYWPHEQIKHFMKYVSCIKHIDSQRRNQFLSNGSTDFFRKLFHWFNIFLIKQLSIVSADNAVFLFKISESTSRIVIWNQTDIFGWIIIIINFCYNDWTSKLVCTFQFRFPYQAIFFLFLLCTCVDFSFWSLMII